MHLNVPFVLFSPYVLFTVCPPGWRLANETYVKGKARHWYLLTHIHFNPSRWSSRNQKVSWKTNGKTCKTFWLFSQRHFFVINYSQVSFLILLDGNFLLIRQNNSCFLYLKDESTSELQDWPSSLSQFLATGLTQCRILIPYPHTHLLSYRTQWDPSTFPWWSVGFRCGNQDVAPPTWTPTGLWTSLRWSKGVPNRNRILTKSSEVTDWYFSSQEINLQKARSQPRNGK